MAKRALCVGINEYPLAGKDLKGCVNDAEAWASLLTAEFDFARQDVRLLLDREATYAAIRRELEELLRGARRGDVLVFTNSSHGTYRKDTSAGGEEGDRYDEAICPYDCRDHLLVDDELRELFSGVPTGVRVAVISDSCHSGSVTRLPPPELTPDDRRARFLDPRDARLPVIDDFLMAQRTPSAIPESEMREVLLSGCRSDQFSFDARFGRKYHGAMTFHALAALEDARYRMSWSRLAKTVVARLSAEGFNQTPQLEGRASAKRRQVFT